MLKSTITTTNNKNFKIH